MTQVKICIAAILLMVVIWHGEQRFKSGELTERDKWQIAADKDESIKLKIAATRLKKVTSDRDEWRGKALELADVKPNIEHETVDEIIKTDTCTNRGDSFVGMFNAHAEQFRIASGIIDRDSD